MSQIRASIELLTKILQENGTLRIKAETFRLAKFNGDEVTPTLWQLLFELLYFCEYEKIDDVAVRVKNEFLPEEMVVFVKHELQSRGFSSQDFALLPPDMRSGSRELLLAVGWLMCKEHILDRFMLRATSPLDNDTSFQYQEEEPSTLSQDFICDPSQRVQQLLWMNNKLRLNLRNLHALQMEKNLLKHKIHESTLGASLTPDRPHLTMLEVYMLRHPEMLKKNLQLVDKDNERLQNLLKWKDHEEIFWKWMESVLDSKLQETGQMLLPDPPENAANDDSIPRLNTARLELHEAIVKYEAIVDHLERLWQNKLCDVSEEELDSVLASLDLELSIQRANITLNNTESYIHEQNHTGQTQWLYEPRGSRSSNNPSGTASVQSSRRSSSNASSAQASPSIQSSDTWRNITDEIAYLQNLVENLQTDISLKKEGYREELQRLSLQLTDVISIPPLTRKL